MMSIIMGIAVGLALAWLLKAISESKEVDRDLARIMRKNDFLAGIDRGCKYRRDLAAAGEDQVKCWRLLDELRDDISKYGKSNDD